MNQSSLTRYDHQIISQWVEPNSRVLDLGCGDGSLLAYLNTHKNTSGYGLELNPSMIPKCIEKGINVLQSNLDKGLSHFDSDSFDYVILSLTLQAMRHPDKIITEMMRVGKQGIVTFPNFGYWKNRLQIGLFGHMPVSDFLPSQWYDTPNIHMCTFRDFEHLCQQLGLHIESRIAANKQTQQSAGLSLLPNLLGEIALYKFKKR